MPKDYDRRKCQVCNSAIEAYQVISGVPIGRSPSGAIIQLYGHYHCVRDELGPEKVLRAAQLGLFPILGDEIFTEDRKLKKYADQIYASSQRPLEKIYEFIGS